MLLRKYCKACGYESSEVCGYKAPFFPKAEPRAALHDMAIHRDPNGGPRRTTIFRSLANRNYKLYFGGQTVSLIGTWVQQAALSWLVYELAKKDAPFWLGLVGFAGQIPGFILAPLAGVVSDRRSRWHLVMSTQSLMLIQAFLLAFLAAENQLSMGWIIGLSVFLGAVNAFDITARQAFLTDMVEDRADFANAIALNSSLFTGTRLIGPSLAGFLLEWLGAAWCFFANGVSYLAVLIALYAMRIKPPTKTREHPPLWANMREGFVYAFRSRPIRALLALLSLTSLVGFPFTVLMPIYAGTVFHGDARTYGIMMGAQGFGAMIGALYLAARESVLGLGIRIAIAPGVLGCGLIGFSLTPWLWLALPILALMGFSMMVQMAASNTILQTIVDEDKRGRVMSFYTMAFLGMAPIGSLLIGALAKDDVLGPYWSLRLGGTCCLAGSIYFFTILPAVRERIRPIYRRMGILPEVAEGLQQATQATVPPEQS